MMEFQELNDELRIIWRHAPLLPQSLPGKGPRTRTWSKAWAMATSRGLCDVMHVKACLPRLDY